MRKLFCFSLLVHVSAGLAHAQCTSALSADGPVFNSAFVPASSGSGFAAVTLNLNPNGSTATVTANTVGMNDVTGLALMRGNTVIAVFTDPANMFQNGSFSRTVAIDPAL